MYHQIVARNIIATRSRNSTGAAVTCVPSTPEKSIFEGRPKTGTPVSACSYAGSSYDGGNSTFGPGMSVDVTTALRLT